MSDDEGVDPEKLFQLNEKKQFKVLDIDTENRKIALSFEEYKSNVRVVWSPTGDLHEGESEKWPTRYKSTTWLQWALCGTYC